MSIIDSVRPGVRAMKGYVPGEQPQGLPRIIKLNTNENPYAPPEPVLQAMRDAIGPNLRRYPEPTSKPVREAAAKALGLTPEQVLVGNGSDDLLTIILRTFVDADQVVAAPDPTYSLYKPLTDIQGGRFRTVPWNADGSLPITKLLSLNPKVIFVVRPNAPTGHAVPLDQVRDLCRRFSGPVVLDEAYGDFCVDNGLPLLADHPNLIVTRSFSKTFGLAAMRIGLGFAAPDVIFEMNKVRDSYNVDLLAQAAAKAVMENLDAYAPIIDAVRSERARLTAALRERGFTVPDSEANFVLATVPEGRRDAAAWMQDLRAQGLIVRYFGSDPRLADKVRISIGTPDEMNALLETIDQFLGDN